MSSTVEPIEVDQAMRMVHATRIARKRKLTYGGIAGIVGSVFGDVTHSLPWEPLLHAETFLEFVAFPISIRRSYAIAMIITKSWVNSWISVRGPH
jgi:hypothetical protein